MPDLEKVISDVIWAFAEWENNTCCPGDDWSDVHQSRDMVIALLKAQELVEPKWRNGYAYCGKCGYKLHWIVEHNNFCPNCGRGLKWE